MIGQGIQERNLEFESISTKLDSLRAQLQISDMKQDTLVKELWGMEITIVDNKHRQPLVEPIQYHLTLKMSN